MWATMKLGTGHRLVMQKDGNLVIYGKDNVVVWAADKQGSPQKLVLQDDGNLVVYGTDGKPLWDSAQKLVCRSLLCPGNVLLPGQKLCSPSGQYIAPLQTDGNLVIYRTVSNPYLNVCTLNSCFQVFTL